MASPKPPILVTGVPRSGTTWLARSLAAAPRTALPGREPMNPRGRQFALGGRLDGWVRREAFSADEAAVLRRCYAGREPRTFSRYGVRQWRAPWPGTRVVVKDPFALLSVAAVTATTGAVPVLLYRHPAAVLASYRRMGWTADTAELAALGAPKPNAADDVDAMAAAWLWMHQVALADLAGLPDAVVVSHSALTAAGPMGLRRLAARLQLDVPPRRSVPARRRLRRPTAVELHNFDRSPAAVEAGWRAEVGADEIARLETATAPAWEQLEARRLPLPVAEPKETYR